MIDFMEESADALVGVRVSGRLTDADYKDSLIPRLEQVFAERGRLRLLCLFDPSFDGWELEAAWDDASFALKHRADFEKMAVVGAPLWVEAAVRYSAFLLKGEMRCFPAERLQDAWKWIRE